MADITIFLPFIVLIGALFLMTRSAKNKQRQAMNMRDQMTPGTGVRTIGGMYATVKEINDDTVLLEVAPGVHALYAKNSVGAVLDDDEYNRVVHGAPTEDLVAPDDASSLTEAADDDSGIDLEKRQDAEEEPQEETEGKRDGGTDAK